MSAEAIIQQIEKDAEQEIKKINKETEKTIKDIETRYQQETKEQQTLILEKGKQDAQNIQKIELSKANQEAKRQQMQKKEQLIETCFTQAFQQLASIDDTQYEQIINRYIDKGREQINDPFYIQSSKKQDNTIAKKHNITVKGTVKATGGIKMISEKGTITIDSTFEGILKKRKQDIRIQVGTILFQE